MSAQPNNWPALLRFDDVEIGRTQVNVHTVTEAEVDAFGHLSGDLNPLHMQHAFAECSPFGRRVVHGLLTAALVSAAHTELTGPGFVYVGQELRCRKEARETHSRDGHDRAQSTRARRAERTFRAEGTALRSCADGAQRGGVTSPRGPHGVNAS